MDTLEAFPIHHEDASRYPNSNGTWNTRTNALTGPYPIPKEFKTFIPYLYKIIPIDIPLIVIRPNTRTTGNRPVHTNGKIKATITAIRPLHT